MNVLIVYAHPNPRSFNAAMREAAVDTLTEAGHAVQVSDLYAMHFKATLDEHDFKERQNPNFFDPTNEQYHAAMRGSFADDIAKEIEKVDWANLVIFQFPLWWQSFPAILKGWVDQVQRTKIIFQFLEGDEGEGIPVGMLRATVAIALNASNTPVAREKVAFGEIGIKVFG